MTSKIMIDELFDLVKNSDVDIIKSKLILLIEYEMSNLNIKYNHNDKFNENEISINLDILEKNYYKNRLTCLRDVLKDIYIQISNIRKYKLITNNYYYSKYILNLAKKYIINHDFEERNSKFLSDEVTRYIKKHKDSNILLKYPILTLEYDINTGNRKNICELYNDMIVSKDNVNFNKELYYEIINNSLNYIEKDDKENLISEFNSYDLINFFEELRDYNKKNKYNNMNVNNLISYINDNNDDSDNLYNMIYGGNK